MRHRTRWMKGFVQTATGHSRKPWTLLRQLGIWRSYAAVVLTWGAALSALVYPLFTGMLMISWLSGKSLIALPRWDGALQAYALTLFAFGALAIFAPA